MSQQSDANATLWKSSEAVHTWSQQADRREQRNAAAYRILVRLLPFSQVERFTVLDLGAGTGVAARAVLKAFPRAEAILADFSPQMIEEGGPVMAAYAGRYRYVEFDMLSSDWPSAIPATIDAVVSSQCIHHIPDSRKQTLFREICERLVPGGWYVNFDPIRTPDPEVEAVWERIANVLDPEQQRRREHPTAQEHARRENHVRYMIELDRQVGYMREAGFRAVDVYWKHLDMVVYGGHSPVSR